MENWKIKLLKLIAKYEFTGEIWWNESLDFYINCNDAFAWACADAELIEESDLGLLEKSILDCKKLLHDKYDFYDSDGLLLFISRKRKERPQNALYSHIDKEFWPLFDAAGPTRPVNIINPNPHPIEGGTYTHEIQDS